MSGGGGLTITGRQKMSFIDNKRKVEITVQNVDSIPCSIVGNKMVFSAGGSIETEPWQTPWPMPWLESVCRELAMEMVDVSRTKNVRLHNHEEPDQYIDVTARSYIDLTVGQLTDQISGLYPMREAIVDSSGSRRFTYEQLKEGTNDLAKGLLSIGLEKDDKVAFLGLNSPEYVIAQLGVGKTGAVMVPMNAYEKEMHLEFLLKQSNTSTVIMQAGLKSTENIELLYRICPELSVAQPGKLKSERLPCLKNVILISDEKYPGTYRWPEVVQMGKTIDDAALLQRQAQLDIEDVVYMIYTSGSTGEPKGVMLSHRNVIENAASMAERMCLSEKDIVCVQAPLFHCFGCVACVLTAVTCGSSMVMVDKFRPETTLELIKQEKCTVVSGVPTMFIAFMNELEKNNYNISTVRTGIIAGSSCPPKLMREIQSVLGIKNIIPAYGLTETSPCVTATYGDDSEELKTTTVGAPIPGVEVKIINPETNEIAPAGVSGEIRIRGYNVMSGYYNMPDETSMTIDGEGWLATGDMGYFLPNGYLKIHGRYKDIIIRSGENISPKEVEDVLATHTAVAEVSVVGVPSYKYGEEVVAFVRVKAENVLTEDELRQFCKGKISTNKTPKEIFFLEQFPVSASGKSLKSELRRLAFDMTSQK